MTPFAPADPLARVHRELNIPPEYARLRGLRPQPEAAETELVEVAINEEGRPVRLIRAAAAAWQDMKSRAALDNLELLALSGFRSVERQTAIIREKLTAGRQLEDILRFVAAPGFSEHHTGRALDIGSPEHIELDEEFAATAAFRWLEAHAAEFGFHLSYPRGNTNGFGYEPWHWCWHASSGVR